MEIRLDSLKKLESASLSPATTRQEDEAVEVIIKVRKENYAPPGIDIRAQIDPCLFTCRIPAKSLQVLEDDPNVVSVALGKKLRVSE